MKKMCLVFTLIISVLLCSCGVEKSGDKNDKQSPISKNNSYAKSVVATKVSKKTFLDFFPDKAFAQEVAKLFNKSYNDSITKTELENYNGGLEFTQNEIGSPKSLKGIGILKSLEYLGCSKNDVEEIPYEICNLQNLKVLNLTKAYCLKKLPNSLGKLKNLEYLTLGFTMVKQLPSSVVNLKSLKHLSISGSLLECLPSDFYKLKNLEYADFGDSVMHYLPESISKLKKLKYLRCRDSNYEKIPDNIGNASALEYIDFFNCHITKVPNSVRKLKKLKYFNVFDNKINNENYKNYLDKSVYECTNPTRNYNNLDKVRELYIKD